MSKTTFRVYGKDRTVPPRTINADRITIYHHEIIFWCDGDTRTVRVTPETVVEQANR